MQKPFLIIGLGNPGSAYAHTPHSVGRNFLIHSRGQWTPLPWEPQRTALADTVSFTRAATPVVYALPRVFMNESGKAVRALLKRFKVPLSRCIVIHDDSDLLLGTVKVARASRSAGHHGVESIFSVLKTKDIARIRIGVRSPQESSKAEHFILKRNTPAQRAAFADTVFPMVERALNQLMRELIAPRDAQ